MARLERLQVHVDGDLLEWLGDRSRLMASGDTPPQQARTELALWREHLAAELRGTTWTLPQIGCVADALNGTLVAPSVGSVLWADLVGAFEDVPGAYGAKWDIDEPALVEKARRLGPTATHALTAAVAQWWADRVDHSREGWASVGVRVIES